MNKRIKFTLCIVLPVLLITSVIIVHNLLNPPEPQFCALCHAAPVHAPSLLNIETGNLTELRIYEPHPVKAGELAAAQRGGYMGISMSGGLHMTIMPDSQQTTTTIPVQRPSLNKSNFCFECRDLLKSSAGNYVLVDLYNEEDIQVFDIREGECCAVRCYTVIASFEDDPHHMTVINKGSLFDK